jgi:hypothetical protein
VVTYQKEMKDMEIGHQNALQIKAQDAATEISTVRSEIRRMDRVAEEEKAQIIQKFKIETKDLKIIHDTEISGLRHDNEVLKGALIGLVYNIKALSDHEVSSTSQGRSQLLLHAAASASAGIAFPCKCISQVSAMIDPFGNDLLEILLTFQEKPVQAVLGMARLLASCSIVEVCRFWRIVFVRLIEEQGPNLIQKLIGELSVELWLELLQYLTSIFEDDPEWDDKNSHPLLQPSLHKWGRFLKPRLQTLRNVELSLGKGPALQCILLGVEGYVVCEILDALALPIIGESGMTSVQKEITRRLAVDGSNAQTIYKALCYMGSMSAEGHNACTHVIERDRGLLPPTADIVLAGYLHSVDIPYGDKSTLMAVGDVLGLYINEYNMPSPFSIESTDQYLSEEIEKLFQEAKRLESLRLAFKELEPGETHYLLLEIGIEDSSPLDDMLADLPDDMVGVVERISYSVLELQLPLTRLTTFVKNSMGALNANNIIVRLQIDERELRFCMHFDDALEEVPPNAWQFPCFILNDASNFDTPTCDSRATPALVHLTGILFRYFQACSPTIAEIERIMASAIESLFQTCIICGASHAVRLNRSTPCSSAECQTAFLNSNLEISLADIRQDPTVVDLLITGVYAASLDNCSYLPPGSPLQGMAAIQKALNSLPPIYEWQSCHYLENAINLLSFETRELLIWIMTTFRGYLVSATGTLKIPSLPGGTTQFFLANTNPDKEREFADRINAGHPRKVLFHGTNMQRLYNILYQGLREMSGTKFQRHGASYGKGIYMAEEPATAWRYTEIFNKNWENSQFYNFRVMLGCEYVGTSSPVSGAVHIIKDPAALMVRYIFIMPANATMPIARHLVPAMESVFANLRAGRL